MLCPKCGYNSFDYYLNCPKCRKDWNPVRRQLFLNSPEPGAINFFAILGNQDSPLVQADPGLVLQKSPAFGLDQPFLDVVEAEPAPPLAPPSQPPREPLDFPEPAPLSLKPQAQPDPLKTVTRAPVPLPPPPSAPVAPPPPPAPPVAPPDPLKTVTKPPMAPPPPPASFSVEPDMGDLLAEPQLANATSTPVDVELFAEPADVVLDATPEVAVFPEAAPEPLDVTWEPTPAAQAAPSPEFDVLDVEPFEAIEAQPEIEPFGDLETLDLEEPPAPPQAAPAPPSPRAPEPPDPAIGQIRKSLASTGDLPKQDPTETFMIQPSSLEVLDQFDNDTHTLALPPDDLAAQPEISLDDDLDLETSGSGFNDELSDEMELDSLDGLDDDD